MRLRGGVATATAERPRASARRVRGGRHSPRGARARETVIPCHGRQRAAYGGCRAGDRRCSGYAEFVPARAASRGGKTPPVGRMLEGEVASVSGVRPPLGRSNILVRVCIYLIAVKLP